MNLRRWLHRHSLKLLAIRDTPDAIAGGVAIGIFFGFAPIIGLKTLSAIFFAWLTRSNVLAAVIAVTLHDLLFVFMPLIYWSEYGVGYWILSRPHHWPAFMDLHLNWATFLKLGKPLLLGGAVCGAPPAALSFALTRRIVVRRQRRKQTRGSADELEETNPS
jgi:uncharacterized protein (DUF2062 family)